MKKYLLLLVGALCFCLNIVAQTYPKKANVIRLLTYNSHYCKGGTDPGNINSYNTQRFALVIKTLDADIVSLQELDSAANSRGKRYLLNEIAQATGLNYTPVYGKAASYDGGSTSQTVRPKRSFRPCRRFTGGLCRFRRGVGIIINVPKTKRIRGVCGSVGFTDFPDFVRGKQSVRLSSPKRLYLRAAARTH